MMTRQAALARSHAAASQSQHLLRSVHSLRLVPSQVTDGAAAVLMMTRREALARGLPIMAVFRSFAAVSAHWIQHTTAYSVIASGGWYAVMLAFPTFLSYS